MVGVETRGVPQQAHPRSDQHCLGVSEPTITLSPTAGWSRLYLIHATIRISGEIPSDRDDREIGRYLLQRRHDIGDMSKHDHPKSRYPDLANAVHCLLLSSSPIDVLTPQFFTAISTRFTSICDIGDSLYNNDGFRYSLSQTSDAG
jgi:hypothetical protein